MGWHRALWLLPGALGEELLRGDLWMHRSGQDTTIRRGGPEGPLVFTSSVADTSEGSDTDSDLKGDEEFFLGCMWTFRQQLELCEGGSCGNAELMAHDLQKRLWETYSDAGQKGTAKPPLEEAAWITLSLSKEERFSMAHSCPGLVVSVLFLMAEVLEFAGAAHKAEQLALEAHQYVAFFERSSQANLGIMLDMFPVQAAFSSYQAVRESGSPSRPASVDIVVARCKSPLGWLWDMELPPSTRVFVYDKCKLGQEDFEKQVDGLRDVATQIEYHSAAELPGSDLMTGECTAYLSHIIQKLDEGPSGGLADFTVFVHDDGPRHMRTALLSLALGSMGRGTYEVPFLHLSHERYPEFRTPCLQEVYREVFGEELQGRLSTYCCSHFIVRRQRIQDRGVAFYKRLHQLVSNAPYARERGGLCQVGKKPCYVMEFMWHRVFGEADVLPLRSEQFSLPLAFRYDSGRATQMPSPLKVAPYMALFQPSRYSSLLMGEAERASG